MSQSITGSVTPVDVTHDAARADIVLINGPPRRALFLLLQRRNAPAQFVYDIIEMTDCILEAINSSTQAYIGALTGRLCPSTLSHDRL
jgi:hypothetical protein